MSTNFAWKHEYDAKLWRHKQCTPNTNSHHLTLNEPPHENFMRMPLARLNALQSAKCTTHHHDAVGYKHLRPAQGPNMGKCRPEKCRPPPPPPGGGQDHERAFAIHSVHQKCCTRHYPPPPPCWGLVLHCSYLLILNLSVILHICATLEGYCC